MAEQKYREEKDTFGPLKVPANRYWGAQTQRSLQNFDIGESRKGVQGTGPRLGREALRKQCGGTCMLWDSSELAMGCNLCAASIPFCWSLLLQARGAAPWDALAGRSSSFLFLPHKRSPVPSGDAFSPC